jgi:hypothetical protein
MSPRYEFTGTSGIPWQDGSPLVFHVLTSLGSHGWDRFVDLVCHGASLVPAAERPAGERSWGRQPTRLFDYDRLAGDDRYLFLSVARPYSVPGSDPYRASGGRDQPPAVAFDLADLFRLGRVAYRPRDIWWHVRDGRVDEGDADQMVRVARAMTVTKRSTVEALVGLETGMLKAPDDGSLRESIKRRVAAIWRNRARTAWRNEYVTREDFLHAFEQRYPIWPYSLGTATDTEVLFEGTLPLAAARFCYNPRIQRWRRMPKCAGGTPR